MQTIIIYYNSGERYSLDTVDDGADGETECTSGAIVVDFGQMGERIEGDCLVAGIVASHVTLATVDAHFLMGLKKFILFASLNSS